MCDGANVAAGSTVDEHLRRMSFAPRYVVRRAALLRVFVLVL